MDLHITSISALLNTVFIFLACLHRYGILGYTSFWHDYFCAAHFKVTFFALPGLEQALFGADFYRVDFLI